MVEPTSAEQIWVGVTNAFFLVLWGVLPGWFLGYAQQSVVARHMRPEFALRKSEAEELNRALSLYDKVRCRMKEIDGRDGDDVGLWSGLFASETSQDRLRSDEFDDLKAHAEHLRATILRLRRQPLQRLRRWSHVLSWRFALGRACASHLLGLMLLIAAFHFSEQAASASELTASTKNALTWYPFDERLFHANAIAAAIAALAVPLFYLLRRVGLRHEYALEFCVLEDLAASDPRLAADHDDAATSATERAETDADGCFAVLGLTAPSTLAAVRDAYRTLIKQNHPDRVQDLSPAIRQLAEAETKKINAAYRCALNLFVS